MDSTHLQLKINEIEISTQDFMTVMPRYNCNHSHNCCEINFCGCCPERDREQRYDTIYAAIYKNVKRITVVERYHYARSHDKMPVHFRFKTGKGKWSKKYYSVGHGMVWGEMGSLGKEPSEKELAYQKTNSTLVMDEEGDYSLIDLEGNQLSIPFQINKPLGNGVFFSGVVIQDKMVYGFSDGNGKKLGPLNIMSITPFGRDGVAIATSSNGLSLVNTKGEFLGEKYYAYLEKLDTDRYSAAIRVKDDRTETNGLVQFDEMLYQRIKQVLLNSKGECLAVLHYNRIRSFSEGFAILEKGKDTFALVNRNGREAIQLNYQYVKDYHNGLLAVHNGSKWGFVDTTGQLVIDFQYSSAGHFYNGSAFVKTSSEQDGKQTSQWIVINKKGKCLKKLRYDGIEDIKNGYAKVSVRGEGWTLIDHTGSELFPIGYLFGDYGLHNSWFCNGLMTRSPVKSSKGAEVINEKGEVVHSLTEFRGASLAFINGDTTKLLPQYFTVNYENQALGISDINGKGLIPQKSNSKVYFCSENRALMTYHIYSDKRVILYDLPSGKEILNLPDMVVSEFIDGAIAVSKDHYSKTEFYDLDGNRLSSL